MTPEQEEQVRRALAVAGGPREPVDPSVPPEVLARLDGVLGELTAGRSAAAERVASAGGAAVADDLAERRSRRSHRPNVLVAAAAVAVIAAAGGAVATDGFGLTSGGGDDGPTSASAGRAPADAPEQASPSGTPGSSSATGPTFAQRRALAADAAGTPRLRSATLRRDVGRVVGRVAGVGAAVPLAQAWLVEPTAVPGSPTPSSSAGGGADVAPTTCLTPATRPGQELVGVRLDGRRASLVLSRPSGGTQLAALYRCGDPSRPVRTLRVPVPGR